MADAPTPRDLRRLQTLEERLGKAQDDRKDLVTERKELRAAVVTHQRRARDLEKETAVAATQIEAVVAENRTLAARLEEAEADLERLRAEALALKQAADAAQARLSAAEATAAEAQKVRATAEKQRDDATGSLAIANKQLAGEKITPVMPAADVAKLVDKLFVDLGTQLPGLSVRDGEMRLKVAFGQVGRDSGFVMPTATSPPEVRENLHELSLRFDRAPDAEPPPKR